MTNYLYSIHVSPHHHLPLPLHPISCHLLCLLLDYLSALGSAPAVEIFAFHIKCHGSQKDVLENNRCTLRCVVTDMTDVGVAIH